MVDVMPGFKVLFAEFFPGFQAADVDMTPDEQALLSVWFDAALEGRTSLELAESVVLAFEAAMRRRIDAVLAGFDEHAWVHVRAALQRRPLDVERVRVTLYAQPDQGNGHRAAIANMLDLYRHCSRRILDFVEKGGAWLPAQT